MESLFSRLFKYRSSDKRVQQENFLTEIFAFLLENVSGLLTAFLNECKVFVQSQPENIKVEPQLSFSTYPDRIQPDVSISFFADNQKWLVFIENKVGALEGEGQLDKYSRYLEEEARHGTKCALLYITRFYDPKPAPSDKIGFGQMRWWQIHEMLARFDDKFVYQARLFMEENNFSLSKSFSTNHITTMIHWNETKEMMDASLGDVVLEKFQKVTQGISKTRADTNFRDTGNYIYKAGKLFWLEMGYFIDEIDENRLYAGGALAIDPNYQKRQ